MKNNRSTTDKTFQPSDLGRRIFFTCRLRTELRLKYKSTMFSWEWVMFLLQV